MERTVSEGGVSCLLLSLQRPVRQGRKLAALVLALELGLSVRRKAASRFQWGRGSPQPAPRMLCETVGPRESPGVGQAGRVSGMWRLTAKLWAGAAPALTFH